jgi:hypothetical protein
MAEDVLERQARALVARTGQPFKYAMETVPGTAAFSSRCSPSASSLSCRPAAEWQASLPWKRIEERHYSWLEGYMEWLKGKEARAEYHALLEEELASLRG